MPVMSRVALAASITHALVGVGHMVSTQSVDIAFGPSPHGLLCLERLDVKP
jgi:hypothetical protein